MDVDITLTQAKYFFLAVVGKPVRKFWNSYGLVLYVEIGDFRLKENTGEWSLFIEGNWWLYRGEDMFIDGVTEKHETLNPKLEHLKGLVVEDFVFDSRAGKSTIHFSGNHRLVIQKRNYFPAWALISRKTHSWLCADGQGNFTYEYRPPVNI